MLPREEVAQLVDAVIQQMAGNGRLPTAPAVAGGAPLGAVAGPAVAVDPAAAVRPDGIYECLDAAVAAARVGQRRLMALSLAVRREIIAAMRQAAVDNALRLAEHAVRETGLGRVEHKVMKNSTAARKTPGVEDVVQVAWSGDHGLTLVERAPFGVIGSITPTTNPTSTVINNAISLIAGGNVPVFCFHPNAVRCSEATVALLNRAVAGAGGPEGLITCLADPTPEKAQALMQHPGVDALLVTGGAAVVKLALAAGKKVWAAGPGNPPTVVDATADLDRAARHVADGASFDNDVLCTGEKACFVVGAVADSFKQLLTQHGAFEVKWSEIDRLQRALLPEAGGGKRMTNPALVGKDAAVLLREAGISFPGAPRLVVCEVPREHPFVTHEMLLPLLPIVRCRDADEAIDLAIAAEGTRKHTASIHSNDIRHMSRMAREWGGTIFVKNGPHYAGFGVGGEGFCTLSIAGTTGDGLTSARTFTRERRCVLVDHFRIV